MSLDLNTITDDWPYESGTIKVRKITGLDGREGTMRGAAAGGNPILSPLSESVSDQ